ncbi:DNA/RNA nuclease SfsA [Vulcanisaeta thermophila]|uniref:DNA/RNA nuclease SfsA n=1 Tax=Vulcanisaeta thermophila TaxID=867917 RepID=UPI00085397C0|nr:DNA/RNA nuclease SfsA [Vulcanisaeta thermophila]
MLGYYLGEPDVQGVFVRRVNRFLGIGVVNGEEVPIHIHDPGRLTELLRPGVRFYAKVKDTGKTRYYLVAVDLGRELVLVNSAIHNHIVKWLITNNYILPGYEVLRTEPRFGNGRLDLLLRSPGGSEAMVEVKGVTLERGGCALFPDAPTKRGARHMEELVKALEAGYEAYVVFLILRDNTVCFAPNKEVDPHFARAFAYAVGRGVRALAFKMRLDRDWYLRPVGLIDIMV